MDDGDAQGGGFERGARSRMAALDFDAALEIGMNAGEDFDECAFARAVFSRQHMHLAWAPLELDIAQDSDLTEALCDTRQAHQRG